MGEILSPNPNPTTTQKHRSIANRIQSPTSPFFLGSNDDNLERAQARAARAAAIRRKSVVLHAQLRPSEDAADPGLGKQQILELFHNCIKLASENKINQKNTWELGLIDHLYEIIKVEEENDTETNFQKASCTLEAGVKIYSLRVDSVHSEAYKVLGGINRAGQDNEQDGTVEDPHVEDGREQGTSKKDVDKKTSPLSTLESSFEALNVKKFDVAFAVDPLYHQTSAQFDEGGAKGLLLNNLGVYGGCRVLFDSLEVPGKWTSCSSQNNMSDTIDISFARDCIEQMMRNMQTNDEISPSLRQIVNLFDEDNKRPADVVSSAQNLEEQMDGNSYSESVFDAGTSYDEHTWGVNQDDDAAVLDESSNFEHPTFPSYGEVNEPFSFADADKENRFDEVEGYLFLSLGYNSKQNAWAGPDYWKYRKPKALEENHTAENVSPTESKRSRNPQPPKKGLRNKKLLESDIDFTSSLDKEIPDIFVPPKSSKSLLLPANRAPCNTKLPEDCHYQPENLVKLFLLPNIMCLGRNKRKQSDDRIQSHEDNGPSTSWDDGSVFDGQYDGNMPSDGEELDDLVSQPRQVNKIEVQYDKTSKQVDVQALKETLWDHIRISPETPAKVEEEAVSFKQILASFPPECRAAATPGDISPHLCFICLLHLANEHGLSLHGSANLDDLSIHLPGHHGI